MAIKKEILDELLKDRDPKTLFSSDGLLGELKKAFAERVLNAEMDHHIQKFRETHSASLKEAVKQGYEQPALDMYFRLTGFRETNVAALWHHRLDQYGPPCRNCGRLLRTKRAAF